MIPSGVVLLLLIGAGFALMLSNRANNFEPAAIWTGVIVLCVSCWGAFGLIGYGIAQVLR